MYEANAEKICIMAIDATKFVNWAMICNVYGYTLVKLSEFNAASVDFKKILKEIEQTKKVMDLKK